jgi:S-adenosylmethionine decarboxylase proenzyme
MQEPKVVEKKVPYYVRLIANLVTEHFIEDPEAVEQLLYAAAKKANNTPIKAVVHKFSPHGVTGVILLAESHIAIHTWPECNYVAVDIFTCGRSTQPYKALEYLKEQFRAREVNVQEIKEG